MAERDEDERKAVRRDFEEAVNMSPRALGDWLDTDESRSVGQDSDGDGESTGHAMGRRILEIRERKVSDLDEDDHDAMAKVVGYVRRHLAQGGPAEGKETSRWRYSLMYWGHDPMG